ncbi:MAG: hypothetical protein SFW36_06350 [Leptolyngbyaceae cyanobacterium bins.59]|nr:hypothetical protein [Leptolyngbyaceae cyanobacterium bins.59]
MHKQIEELFDEAENRYLKTEELNVLSQYVSSLPERLETYRLIRDQELDIMQQVVDQLQKQMPDEPIANLERSIKNALLVVRHCAMGMLLNDENYIQDRALNWLSRTAQVYNTQTIDTVLYRLLTQRLSQVLTPQQLGLFNPFLQLVQQRLLVSAS